MMNAASAARQIVDCFDEDRIPYAIGGAIALGALGAPRATKDVDISAFVPLSELGRVLDSLERAGVMLDRAAATMDAERIGLVKGRLGRIIIDVFVSEHPQYGEMARRRVAIDSIWFLSAEDLCLHKLIYGRPKDIIDLERLLAVRPSTDLAYVRKWLGDMVPEGDRRFAVLDDLEARFLSRK